MMLSCKLWRGASAPTAVGTPAELHHQGPGPAQGEGPRTWMWSALSGHHRQGADGLHVLGRKAFEHTHGVTELLELLDEETRRPLESAQE